MGSLLRTRLRNLSQGLWFVPSLAVVALGALAFLLVQVDEGIRWTSTTWVFGGDPNAARTVLSTIAGSLITVAGLTFSVTMVVLQLASSQFSPRVLPNVLGDRLTQITVGTFVGIFVYCLVALRAVGAHSFVPRLTVTVASGLAVLAVVLLIVFIHHVSTMIQVSHVASRIGRSTLKQLDVLHPAAYGEAGADEDAEAVLGGWYGASEPATVHAAEPGFVVDVAVDALVEGLEGVRLHVPVVPGDFVTPGTPLVLVWPADRYDPCSRRARRAIPVARERTAAADVGFGVRQLADVALRAISPGVNDPTTAITCLGYLRAIVERLAGRDFPSEVRRWPDRDVVAVVARRPFEQYVHELDEVSRYAGADLRVVRALLETCAGAARAAAAAGAAARVETLHAAVERIAARAAPQLLGDADRSELSALVERARAAARPS
jgi:uncharacterized membrane protein